MIEEDEGETDGEEGGSRGSREVGGSEDDRAEYVVSKGC